MFQSKQSVSFCLIIIHSDVNFLIILEIISGQMENLHSDILNEIIIFVYFMYNLLPMNVIRIFLNKNYRLELKHVFSFI